MNVARRLGPFGPRAIARFYRLRDLAVEIEGAGHLPRHGGALLAVRHYHHLYDGAALIDALPRVPKIFVALDWIATPRIRAAMETACRLAGWPVALRASARPHDGDTGAYAPSEILAYVRRAIADGAALLERGELLVVFPEGVPTRDVGDAVTKPADDTILPFRGGFLSIVSLAQRSSGVNGRRMLRRLVPIVPVGLAYERTRGRRRYRVRIRIGEPRYFEAARDERAPFVAEIEAAVRELSGPQASGVRPPDASPRSEAGSGDRITTLREALIRVRDDRANRAGRRDAAFRRPGREDRLRARHAAQAEALRALAERLGAGDASRKD